MSHLGDHLSALVDGELSGAELDRANAHVAACGACRVEANALRRLKHELRALAEVCDADGITNRLLAMTGQPCAEDQPVPANLAGLAYPRDRARIVDLAGERDRRRGMRSPAAPYSAAASRRRVTRRGRGRYVLWTTLSLIAVGIGSAAFGMGGSTASPGPQITPQLEVFDMQHAITSGDVPFADPADVSARVPAVAATP
ncbi:MAG TPA: zf-HC2 domain-containing protein [Trebonia sp.]